MAVAPRIRNGGNCQHQLHQRERSRQSIIQHLCRAENAAGCLTRQMSSAVGNQPSKQQSHRDKKWARTHTAVQIHPQRTTQPSSQPPAFWHIPLSFHFSSLSFYVPELTQGPRLRGAGARELSNQSLGIPRTAHAAATYIGGRGVEIQCPIGHCSRVVKFIQASGINVFR
jgi:hypothetical protein